MLENRLETSTDDEAFPITDCPADQVATSVLQSVTASADRDRLLQLTRREYALLAIGAGAALLALLPVLLQFFGSRWAAVRPSVRPRKAA